MSYLRGILFDNLGLKFAALLLAVVVYVNVRTDQSTTMLVSFPLEYVDLDDSLSLSGPSPSVVQAELRGTGKQLILMRVKEPRMRLSLSGARQGRFERTLAPSDLPLPADGAITVENLVGPRVVTLEVDRKAHRDVRVVPQVSGQPAAGRRWDGLALVDPESVRVTGPERVLLTLDSLRLATVRLDGKRDTVTAFVAPEGVPDQCRVTPSSVRVRLPILKHGQ